MDIIIYWRLGILILLPFGVDKVTLRNVEPTAYHCYGDICNLNRTDQYCDMASRFCRRCSDIQDDCFSALHVNNCSTFCYDLRHRRDQDKERVAGCRVPTPPANGSFDTMLSKVPYNTTLRASCYQGYRLSCTTVLQCGEYGILRGTTPECKEITCPALPEVFHGRWQLNVQNNTYPPGTTATLHCEKGFILHGNQIRTCSLDGVWTSDVPFHACILNENSSGHSAVTIALSVILSAVIVVYFITLLVWIRKRKKKTRMLRRKDSTQAKLEETNILQDAFEDEHHSMLPGSIPRVRSFSVDVITPQTHTDEENPKVRETQSATDLPAQNVVQVHLNLDISNNVVVRNPATQDSGINLSGSANSSRSDSPLCYSFPIQETTGNASEDASSANI